MVPFHQNKRYSEFCKLQIYQAYEPYNEVVGENDGVAPRRGIKYYGGPVWIYARYRGGTGKYELGDRYVK